MVKAMPSTSLDRLSGSKTQLMTDLSKLVANRGSAPLMAMPCHWFAEVASCTFLYLVNPQRQIKRGTQPPWSNDTDKRFAFDPNFDEFVDYMQRAIQTHSILDDSSIPLT